MSVKNGNIKPAHSQDKPPQPRLKEIERKQVILCVVDIDGLVAEDHEVRAIWELVRMLNMSRYHEDIRAVEGVAGREPVNPLLLICLWIYAYSQGVSSAREIARLCGYHPAYRWLCGNQMINYHTLSDFRMKHKEALDGIFAEILGVLSSEGMIELDRVMHDGTKIKAFASADSFRREERILAHLELAREQVARMEDPSCAEVMDSKTLAARKRTAQERQKRLETAMKELKKLQDSKPGADSKAETRVSRSDPEARVMKQSNGGYAPSYNVQISTDAKAGVIVGVEASQSVSDYDELLPAVETVTNRFGRKPNQMVVDGGYMSRQNILAMNEVKVDLIGPPAEGTRQSAGQMKRRDVAPAFNPKHFKYDETSDTYTCPAGKILRYESKEEKPGLTNYKYRAMRSDCFLCAFKKECSPQSITKGRAVMRGVENAAVTAFRAKTQTAEAKEIYKQRGPIAEFPNAWIKDKFKIRQFRLRGRIKVLMEMLWACLTYNIKQWIRLRWKPRCQAAMSC